MPVEMPRGWERVPISSLLEWNAPGFWGEEPRGITMAVRVLRSTNFTDGGRLDLSDIAERAFPERIMQAKRLQFGDILLERSGGGPNKPVGRVCLFEEHGEYYYSNFIQGLRCRTGIDHRFAFYMLWFLHNSGTTRQLQQATTGIRNLAYDDYLSWMVLLPPIAQQKKIAAILSSVDEAILATQSVIDQTRRVKEGLLQDLLTRGIGHTRFKQTEIGEIPESWEIRRLDELCSRVGVGIASSATHAYRDTGVPLVRNQNIKYGYLDLSDLLYVDEHYDLENRSKRIRAGDVLTIRTGYPGVSAVVPQELDNAQSFTTLVSTPKPKLIRSHFLAYWINGPVGRRLVLAGEAGGAQHNLNAGELKRMPVPVPPLGEQDRIMSALEAVSASEMIECQTVSSLAMAKSALLDDLLTGRRRVTP